MELKEVYVGQENFVDYWNNMFVAKISIFNNMLFLKKNKKRVLGGIVMKTIKYQVPFSLTDKSEELLEYEVLEDINIFSTDNIYRLEFCRFEGNKAIFVAYWINKPFSTTYLEVSPSD